MRLSRHSKTDIMMETYCIMLLRKLQNDLCAICHEPLFDYQLHHKRYGDDITIYDLELIHGLCHADEHGIKGVRGKVRNHNKPDITTPRPPVRSGSDHP